MSYYITGINYLDKTTLYSPQGAMVAILCDAVADLPTKSALGTASGYTPLMGTVANIIADGSTYIMNSSGTWVRQPMDGGGMDPSDYYTKAETDAEIGAQIMDLDVPDIGGSTKYIKLVGQSDGLVTATAGSIDASPAYLSQNLVQSGGVYTAVKAVEDLPRYFSTPTNIPNGTYLDDLTTPGAYWCTSSGNCGTLYDRPVNSSAFRLDVLYSTGTNRFIQILYAGASTLYKRNYTAAGWGDWYKFTGEITTTINPHPVPDNLNLGGNELRSVRIDESEELRGDEER